MCVYRMCHRTYYKAQDELITAYEDMSVKVTTEVTETNALKRQQRMASLFSKITFGVNFVSTRERERSGGSNAA